MAARLCRGGDGGRSGRLVRGDGVVPPSGLPIPHTAIIPSNKDRLADAMAGFLRVYFLKPQVVLRRLKAVNFGSLVGTFLIDPSRGGQARLRQGTAGLLSDILHSLAGEQLGTMAAMLRGQLEKLDLAPLLGQLLRRRCQDGRHRPLIEAALRWAGLTLEDNEELLRKMIHDRANTILRWTGLDETLANGFWMASTSCWPNAWSILTIPCAPGWRRWASLPMICCMIPRCRPRWRP
jgi:uncharacterized membrane-anchored protein YjiN (DUF445 family)